jgi:hypothetical protein
MDKITNLEEIFESCHVCGAQFVELYKCERCDECYCDNCSSTFDQFSCIDYNCCKPCQERNYEDGN